MKQAIQILHIFLAAILSTAALIWLVATGVHVSVVEHPFLVDAMAFLAVCGIVVMSLLAHLHFVKSRKEK